MEYFVTFKIDGRFVAQVTADNVQDAIKEATAAYQDADFGSLECIDADAVVVEDERGNYVWEK